MIASVLRVTQKARSSQFEVLGAQPGSIVFLGDSITEGGLWSEWLPEDVVSNRGIGGETTAQIRARLDSAIDSPGAVFFLGGTNDLAVGHSVEDISEMVVAIMDEILRRAPGCPIFIQSVMPRHAGYAAEIIALNAQLQRATRDRPGVRYVDLWPALAAPDHALRADFTNDGLHLNGAGYAAWVAVLEPLITELR